MLRSYSSFHRGTIGGGTIIEDNLAGCNSVEDIVNAGPCEFEAVIDIKPGILNLKSRSKYIFSKIKLPETYDSKDIDRDSLELSIPSCTDCGVIFSNYEFPLLRCFIAIFPRQDLIDEVKTMDLELPTKLDLKVNGELNDGTPFEGLDTIRVIKPKKRKKYTKRK